MEKPEKVEALYCARCKKQIFTHAHCLNFTDAKLYFHRRKGKDPNCWKIFKAKSEIEKKYILTKMKDTEVIYDRLEKA